MTSTIRYNSFKGAGPHNQSTRRTVIIIAALMFAVYSWSQVTLLLLAVTYASLGPLGKLFSLLRPRGSITTETAETN